MTETAKLKVDDALKGKCHDGVPVENEVTAIIHLFGGVPSVNAECALGSAVQAKAHDLCIVKTWNTSEPGDQIGATWDAGVDCPYFVHVVQESSDAGLVK